MYAIIEASGSQHRVSEGDVIELDRLGADENATITFDKVLLVGGDDSKIGQPYVEGATVSATVVNHYRGEKIDVFKYKRRQRYRKSIGFRAEKTTVRIDSIKG